MKLSHIRLGILIVIGVFSLSLAGCAQTITPMPTQIPTHTSTSTVTPTSTKVWFPPTVTHTPMPTEDVAPTPDRKPGIGTLIIEDGFAAPENWQVFESESSSAAFANNTLTLVSSQNSQYILSYQSGELIGNGYMEITIRLNLCGTADEFGVIIRSQPDTDQYRLGMSCDGRVWVDRKYKSIFQNIVPKINFGLVPSTAPDTVTIGIWMNGSTVRFFLDDFYLFELNDSIYYSGGLGVYIRSLEGSSISASFSELKVYEIQP